MKKRLVMVFGVFDGLHAGHRHFLRQACLRGERLIAVVARSIAVRALKHKTPRDSQRMRLASLRKIRAVTRAVLGDKTQGTYGVIKRYKPDVLCLGYDQHALRRDIEEKMRQGSIPRRKLVRIRPFKPHRYHTSLS